MSCRYACVGVTSTPRRASSTAGVDELAPGQRPEAAVRLLEPARRARARRPTPGPMRKIWRRLAVERDVDGVHRRGIGAAARHRDEEVEQPRRAVARAVDEHEAAAARRRSSSDSVTQRGEAGGDRGVDRVAAFREHARADLGRDRVSRCDRSAHTGGVCASDRDELPSRRAHRAPGLPRPAVETAARGVGVAAVRRRRARHPPPRRPLRRLRRLAVRAEGAAAASRRARVPAAPRARATSAFRRSRRSASSSERGASDEVGAAHALPRVLAAVPARADARGPPRAARPAARRVRASCSCACTSRASSGATARCRTRSSAATPASCPRTSSTRRPASCTSSCRTGSAAHDLELARENLVRRAARRRSRRRAARSSSRCSARTSGCGAS